MSSRRSRRGRHEERNYVEPVKQVLPEPAGGDFILQILVRGRDDSHIHAHARRSADRLEAVFFEDAQHLGLRLDRHVGDLVEE
jgi:hypothetical protein